MKQPILPTFGLAFPKAIPSLAVFAWKLFAGNANCSYLRHHAVWAIAANLFFAGYLHAQLVSTGPPFSHGTFSRRELSFFFSGFPQGRNYSGGIGDAWHPWKTKGGSCYNHKTNPEIGKKINQWQPNILLFPLIPTKARTTKLVQKLEKHPKPTKTMFSQWVAERKFV